MKFKNVKVVRITPAMPPDLLFCLWPGLGRQSGRHAARASLAGVTPASDRAAAAVAGPPLTVSVLLLLLSLTREKNL